MGSSVIGTYHLPGYIYDFLRAIAETDIDECCWDSEVLEMESDQSIGQCSLLGLREGAAVLYFVDGHGGQQRGKGRKSRWSSVAGTALESHSDVVSDEPQSLYKAEPSDRCAAHSVSFSQVLVGGLAVLVIVGRVGS